jgi:spore germination protein GerM
VSVRRRLRLLTALLAGVLALTGCGVPADRSPSPIDPSSVPFGLSDPAPSGETVSPSPTTALDAPKVYLVDPTRPTTYLVSRSRSGQLPADPVVALQVVLLDLAQGPNADDRTLGLTSAVPPGAVLTLAKLDAGTATIDLSGDFANPPVAEQPQFAGQIVLTATAVPGVEQVLLTSNGQQLQLPVADGSITGLPLTATDYSSLLAPRAATSSQAG